MKFVANIVVIVFIILAGYILINEKSGIRRSPAKKVAVITGSNSKLIGQLPSRDLLPLELQRQRINNETVYKFQSNSTGLSYELEEGDLDKFGVQLIDFQNVNRHHAPIRGMINDSKGKNF